MLSNIKSFRLFLFADANSDGDLKDKEDHEGENEGRNGDCEHTDKLSTNEFSWQP